MSASREQKKGFMSWFDSLDYDPERDLRIEMEARAASLRKSTAKRGGRRGGVAPKYLEIPQRYQAPPKEARHSSQHQGAKSTPSHVAVRLPRVATLKTKPARKMVLDATHFKAASPQKKTEEAKAGYLFWRECSLPRALEKARVSFLPTVVFDMAQRSIRWMCFREEARDFASTKDLASCYARITQSLCHYGGSPLVRVRSFEIDHAAAVPETYLLNKKDVIDCIEGLCRTFSGPAAKAPCGLVLLQAVVPPHFGRLARLAKSGIERRLGRHCSIADLEGQILVEEAGNEANDDDDDEEEDDDGAEIDVTEAESKRGGRDPHVCAADRTKDRRRAGRRQRPRELLCDVRSFRTQSSSLSDAKARHLAQKSRSVAQEAHKSEADRLREGLQWCIGDVHHNASLEVLRAAHPSAKRPCVYKLVLAHRYEIDDARQLAESLPEKLRVRMFETVKICEVCFEELAALEQARQDAEEARREAARLARVRTKLEKLGRRVARQASELARIRLHEMRSKSTTRTCSEDGVPKDQESKYVDAADLDEDPSPASTPAVVAATLGGLEAPTRADRPARPAGSRKSEPRNAKLGQVVKDGGKQISAMSARRSDETDSAQKVLANQVEEQAPDTEATAFDNIACSSFFGNEVEKLELCQGIMDALRAGREARVRAPLELNNGSTEEARLVLRSLYLEFRGMCVDQGYFPDVPIQDGAAVMLMQPLPSYVDYASQQRTSM